MNTLIFLWVWLFGAVVQTTVNTTTTYETVRYAVCREFGSECALALAVFTAESHLYPSATGDNGKSIGVAQIHIPAHAKKIPVADKEAWLKNFQNNIRLAKKIRDKSGWEAWSAYKNKQYLLYLK